MTTTITKMLPIKLVDICAYRTFYKNHPDASFDSITIDSAKLDYYGNYPAVTSHGGIISISPNNLVKKYAIKADVPVRKYKADELTEGTICHSTNPTSAFTQMTILGPTVDQYGDLKVEGIHRNGDKVRTTRSPYDLKSLYGLAETATLKPKGPKVGDKVKPADYKVGMVLGAVDSMTDFAKVRITAINDKKVTVLGFKRNGDTCPSHYQHLEWFYDTLLDDTHETGVDAIKAGLQSDIAAMEAKLAEMKVKLAAPSAPAKTAAEAAKPKWRNVDGCEVTNILAADSTWLVGCTMTVRVRFAPNGKVYTYLLHKQGKDQWITSAAAQAGRLVTFAEATNFLDTAVEVERHGIVSHVHRRRFTKS